MDKDIIIDPFNSAQIIEACRQNGFDTNRLYCRSIDGRSLFVKYYNVTLAEARTQTYFFEQVLSRPDLTIRIPQVYNAVQEGWLCCIVMEHINFQSFADENQRIDALVQLLSVNPPPAAAPGPIGGSLIKHIIFQESKAALEYASVDELQEHFNQVFFSYFFSSYLPTYWCSRRSLRGKTKTRW